MAVQRKLDKHSHLYLIDGSGYIFRAYHALPPLTRSDGTPVGAVQGFCNMLWKLLEDLKGEDQPSHLAVIFDHSGKSFRNDLYDQYKANRPPAPEDLVPQFPLIRDATRAFGVPCIELENYEADDLIATYTRQARDAGARVTIVSSDKDLMQLIEDGQVTLFDTMKNKRIDSEGVREKFGVTPDKVIEVQALIGDSVDNVPGVPGIGRCGTNGGICCRMFWQMVGGRYGGCRAAREAGRENTGCGAESRAFARRPAGRTGAGRILCCVPNSDSCRAEAARHAGEGREGAGWRLFAGLRARGGGAGRPSGRPARTDRARPQRPAPWGRRHGRRPDAPL